MSVTFADLEKKYDGFRRPFLTVKVDGAADDSINVFINKVELTLTSGAEAGCCTFEISAKDNALEEAGVSLDADVKKYLDLGAELEISMGYNDAEGCQSVFTGVVSAVTFRLDGGKPYHTVEVMDCKVLLMNNRRSEVKEGLTRDSEAVAQVLKNYGALASDRTVDETPARTAPICQWGQSDYEFLTELARRSDALFFVDRGKVKFLLPASIDEVSVVLTPGSHLVRLERTATLAGQHKSVTVLTHDPADPATPIQATAAAADAVGGGSKDPATACGKVDAQAVALFHDGGVRTEEEARALAKARLQQSALGFVTGSFETVGAPALLPGTLVELEGFGDPVNGKYLITEAVHKLEIDSYHTICKFARSQD